MNGLGNLDFDFSDTREKGRIGSNFCRVEALELERLLRLRIEFERSIADGVGLERINTSAKWNSCAKTDRHKMLLKKEGEKNEERNERKTV